LEKFNGALTSGQVAAVKRRHRSKRTASSIIKYDEEFAW
jgi:hypothetical protein